MPIMSYLAYPVTGARETLATELAAFPECEVVPAQNQEVMILLTDTCDQENEKALQSKLEKVKSLQCLAMVSGFHGEHSLNGCGA